MTRMMTTITTTMKTVTNEDDNTTMIIMMTIINKMQPLDPVHAVVKPYNPAVKAKNGPEPRAGQIDATRFHGHGERSFTADVPSNYMKSDRPESDRPEEPKISVSSRLQIEAIFN